MSRSPGPTEVSDVFQKGPVREVVRTKEVNSTLGTRGRHGGTVTDSIPIHFPTCVDSRYRWKDRRDTSG